MRLLAFALLFAALPAAASDVGGWTSFRCPTTGRILNLGATRHEVRTLCREPDDALARVETRLVQRRVRRSDAVATTRTSSQRTQAALPPPVTVMYSLPAPGQARTTFETTETRHRAARTDELLVEELVEVQVEEWVFDFGRNRFLRKLRFENGLLVAIVDGARGAGEPE